MITRPRFRRRGDIWRPVLAAVLTSLATGLSECSFQAISDKAKSEYWRHYQTHAEAQIQSLQSQLRR